MEDRAFIGCESLTSITLPEGLETVGKSAFYRCTNLDDSTRGELRRRFGWRIF
nr:leucine-rich repeat protein [uncultured Porphyromonas sp.]